MENQELIDLFDEFLMNQGLWYPFKAFAKSRGYDVVELGFPDEDED